MAPCRIRRHHSGHLLPFEQTIIFLFEITWRERERRGITRNAADDVAVVVDVVEGQLRRGRTLRL